MMVELHWCGLAYSFHCQIYGKRSSHEWRSTKLFRSVQTNASKNLIAFLRHKGLALLPILGGSYFRKLAVCCDHNFFILSSYSLSFCLQKPVTQATLGHGSKLQMKTQCILASPWRPGVLRLLFHALKIFPLSKENGTHRQPVFKTYSFPSES